MCRLLAVARCYRGPSRVQIDEVLLNEQSLLQRHRSDTRLSVLVGLAQSRYVIHVALRFVEANFGRLIVNFQLVPIVVPLWFH
jgi:hypothetical protein